MLLSMCFSLSTCLYLCPFGVAFWLNFSCFYGFQKGSQAVFRCDSVACSSFRALLFCCRQVLLVLFVVVVVVVVAVAVVVVVGGGGGVVFLSSSLSNPAVSETDLLISRNAPAPQGIRTHEGHGPAKQEIRVRGQRQGRQPLNVHVQAVQA